MNSIKEIARLNELELAQNITNPAASWHAQFAHSAYVFVSGLDPRLTDGDLLCVFSEVGDPVHVHMPRHADTGKPRGFAFIMYADARSAVLAVDNLNGIRLLNRTLRVDHSEGFKHLERDATTGKMVETEHEALNARWQDEHLRFPDKPPFIPQAPVGRMPDQEKHAKRAAREDERQVKIARKQARDAIRLARLQRTSI